MRFLLIALWIILAIAVLIAAGALALLGLGVWLAIEPPPEREGES